jgi:hypothetical protein
MEGGKELMDIETITSFVPVLDMQEREIKEMLS